MCVSTCLSNKFTVFLSGYVKLLWNKILYFLLCSQVLPGFILLKYLPGLNCFHLITSIRLRRHVLFIHCGHTHCGETADHTPCGLLPTRIRCLLIFTDLTTDVTLPLTQPLERSPYWKIPPKFRWWFWVERHI